MPFVVLYTREDPLKVRSVPRGRKEHLLTFITSKCEAYTFLAGSLGSLSITLWFLPVL